MDVRAELVAALGRGGIFAESPRPDDALPAKDPEDVDTCQKKTSNPNPSLCAYQESPTGGESLDVPSTDVEGVDGLRGGERCILLDALRPEEALL